MAEFWSGLIIVWGCLIGAGWLLSALAMILAQVLA